MELRHIIGRLCAFLKTIWYLGRECPPKNDTASNAVKPLVGLFIAFLAPIVSGGLIQYWQGVPMLAYTVFFLVSVVILVVVFIVRHATDDRLTFLVGTTILWLCLAVFVPSFIAFLCGRLPGQQLLPVQPSGIQVAAETPEGLPGLKTDIRLFSRHFKWGFPTETCLYVSTNTQVSRRWDISQRARVKESAPNSAVVNDGIGCPNDRGPSTVRINGLTNGHTYTATVFFTPTNEDFIEDCQRVAGLKRGSVQDQEQINRITDKWTRFAEEWRDELRVGTHITVSPQNPE